MPEIIEVEEKHKQQNIKLNNTINSSSSISTSKNEINLFNVNSNKQGNKRCLFLELNFLKNIIWKKTKNNKICRYPSLI